MKNDRKSKVLCNTNRICEVEDAVVEWISVKSLYQDSNPLTPKKSKNN